MIGGDKSWTRSPGGPQLKQLTKKICLQMIAANPPKASRAK